MEIWAILAPLVKVLLYVLSFLAVGTGLFIFHFRSFLSQPTLAYCCKLCRKSSLTGSIIAPLLLLMTAGNIGGDLQSAFDPLMINIVLSSKAGQSVLVLFFGFLLVLLWIKAFLFKLFFATTLLGIGALNKFRLVPQLKNNNLSHAIKLRKSINVEISILFIILVISSLLTTSIELPLK